MNTSVFKKSVALGVILLPATLVAQVPSSLVSFWNFDEASSGTADAQDVANANGFGAVNDTGVFQGSNDRTAGLIGTGAARIDSRGGVQVLDSAAGTNGADFDFSSGITLETVFATTNLGDNIQNVFRIESGNDRVLFSFQDSGNINGGASNPGIAFGLNIGGYSELDVEFDGVDGRPTLAGLNDGNTHHLVATYDSTSGTRAIYIDGALVGSDTRSGTIVSSTDGHEALLGDTPEPSPPSDFFEGTLDEFAIYKGALTAQEVSDHWTNVQGGDAYFVVPEPSTLSFLVAFLAVFGLHRRRLRS